MKHSFRPIVYQLFVRLFGNMRERRKPGGTIEENGCGKFADIKDKALEGIRAMGFTHVWLTGVLDFSRGKGLAGDVFDIRNPRDISPDYARKPEHRLEEFKTLLARCRKHGLEPLMDFVPPRSMETVSPPPAPGAWPHEVPVSWREMDAVLGFWLEAGVAGFRVLEADRAPADFWSWTIRRCRDLRPQALFLGSTHEEDAAPGPWVAAGFDAMDDLPCRRLLKESCEGRGLADAVFGPAAEPGNLQHALRFAETHDRVRLANPKVWGGGGMKVGKPVCAVLYLLGRGPILLYNGQETGEPAIGREGFDGDDARTTRFDYWSMPELAKWVNGGKFDGGRLSPAQKELRGWYASLLGLAREPAFAEGELRPLAIEGAHDGCVAFLRQDRGTRQAFLVVANLRTEVVPEGARVKFPVEIRRWLGREGLSVWRFSNRVPPAWKAYFESAEGGKKGFELPELPGCSTWVLEIR